MLVNLTEVGIETSIVRGSTLVDFKLPAALIQELSDAMKDKGYRFGNYTSSAVTDKQKGKYGEDDYIPEKIALIPNQYLLFACKLYDFAIELKKYFEYYEALKSNAKKLVGSYGQIEKAINSDPDMSSQFMVKNDIELFSKLIDKDDNSYRFKAKRLISDSGAPRPSKDCFGSIILKVVNMPDSSSEIFGKLIYELASNPSLYEKLKQYIEELNSNCTGRKELLRTSSIREFALSVLNYFFKDKWQIIIAGSIYSEASINNLGYRSLQFQNFSRIIGEFEGEVSKEKLSSSGTQRFFETPVYMQHGKYYYFSTQWNGDGESNLTFNNLKNYIETDYPDFCIEKVGAEYFLYDLQSKRNIINASKLSKPFILLAGISGTGKTRFVRKQASAHNVGSSNYCLVPVRPDWHEPSDLLGYVSRIGSKPKYVSTKVLQFIIDAWKAVAPSASKTGTGELHLNSPPYWLCLDEMNLAPVEQYFADYISVLESRKFADGEYSCEALLDKSILNNDEYDIQADLNLSDDAELWDYFCEFGIGIPPNLIVAGTVNMDETTHGFSRKVIDRAVTIDFGEFYPNEYDNFFKGQAEPKILTYGVETRARLETMDCIADSDGSSSVAFLKAVNDVLEGTPFQLAYRALNELLLFVNSFAPASQEKLQAVWDDFLMTKVLPRIDGDEDKLRITRDGVHTNLLKELERILEEQLDLIWSDDTRRLDLLRVDAQDNEIKDVPCRSKKKIKWMNERLEANTFTSYWP